MWEQMTRRRWLHQTMLGCRRDCSFNKKRSRRRCSLWWGLVSLVRFLFRGWTQQWMKLQQNLGRSHELPCFFLAQPVTSKVLLFLLWSDRTPLHLDSSPNTIIIQSICPIIGKSRSETIGIQFCCKCGRTNNHLFCSNTCPVWMKTPSWLWMPCLNTTYIVWRKDVVFVERAHY